MALAKEAMVEYYAWRRNLRQIVALTRRAADVVWLEEGGPDRLLLSVESGRAAYGLGVSLEVCASVMRAGTADTTGVHPPRDRDQCAEPVAFAWRCLEILRHNRTHGTTVMARLALEAAQDEPLVPDEVEQALDLLSPYDTAVEDGVDGVVKLLDIVSGHLDSLEMDLRHLHNLRRTIRRRR